MASLKKTLTKGTIIHGTMQPTTIVAALCDVLEHVSDGEHADLIQDARDTLANDPHSEDVHWLMDELYHILEEQYAPSGCYVGAHIGDPADVGVWAYR